MKQTKKTHFGWQLLSIFPMAGILTAGLGFSVPAYAGPIILNPALPSQPVGHIAPQGHPDLQVRVWVDNVHQNANHTYNFTIRGQLKNVGTADYVSRRNQQVLFLHEARKAHHISDWHFSRLNRGQVKNVHVPVINHPGGEFVPAYELALSFDPDIYMDRNPANDDRNRRNNQATLSSRTLSGAFARASGGGGVRGVHVRPVGVHPGIIRTAPRLAPLKKRVHHKPVKAKIVGNKLFLMDKNGSKRLAPNDLYHVGKGGLIEMRGGVIIRNTVNPFGMKELKEKGAVVTPNC